MTNRLSPVIESNNDNKEPPSSVALVQVLLALLWSQHETSARRPHEIQTFGLTCRERSVLGLLADGLTADAIARRLGISPRTVHAHLSHVYRKLGVSDRMDAVLVGHAAGLIAIDLDRHTTCDQIQRPGDPGSRPRPGRPANELVPR